MRRRGATLRCGARASRCGGFFCCGAQALGAGASVVARASFKYTESVPGFLSPHTHTLAMSSGEWAISVPENRGTSEPQWISENNT